MAAAEYDLVDCATTRQGNPGPQAQKGNRPRFELLSNCGPIHRRQPFRDIQYEVFGPDLWHADYE